MKPTQLKTITHSYEFGHVSHVYIVGADTHEFLITTRAWNRDDCIQEALSAAYKILDERAEKQAKLEVILEAILESVFGKGVTQ